MKKLLLGLCIASSLARADVIVFDVGPDGLNPNNEVPAVVVPSTGTGGVIESGVWFDTVASNLSFVLGYGSAAGFQDLTGPALAAHIHGPASTAESAGVLFNLGAQHFPNSDPSRGGILRGMVQYETPESVAALLGGQHYVNLHTAANPAGEIRGQLQPRLNHAPSVTCPAPVESECTRMAGTEIELAAKVSDPEGDPMTVIWLVQGMATATNEIPATAAGTETEVKFATAYPLGSHSVEVRVSDGKLEAVCTTTVTVVDRSSPVIHEIAANPKYLWPPNHKMVPVRVRVHALDCSPVTSRIVSVTSNEPVNELGDGNTLPDWQITGDLTLNLRAERSGRGTGRVYTIVVETTDGISPPTRSRIQVRVQHSMGSGK
jgi:hypothetical protein